LAEDTEIVIDLDLAVLRHAVVDFARWQPQHPSLQLNVNLSGLHFDHPDCVERITAAITTSGVAPGAVNLEVTETTAMAAHSEDRGFLAELRERGFQILLDDFGTGFSSVKQMLRLPVDGIKLDRAVTAAVGTRVGDAVVRALVGLAADLDLSTVIEGVETPAQAARVQELGCTQAQGYLWTPPVPAAEDDHGVALPRAVGAARQTPHPGVVLVVYLASHALRHFHLGLMWLGRLVVSAWREG